MSLEAVNTELEKIDSVLVTARRLLAEGKSVDLSSIEDKVRAVCALAEKTEAAERPMILESLNRLMVELDTIAGEIESKHNDMLGTEEGRSAAGAAQAYGNVQGRDTQEDGDS